MKQESSHSSRFCKILKSLTKLNPPWEKDVNWTCWTFNVELYMLLQYLYWSFWPIFDHRHRMDASTKMRLYAEKVSSKHFLMLVTKHFWHTTKGYDKNMLLTLFCIYEGFIDNVNLTGYYCYYDGALQNVICFPCFLKVKNGAICRQIIGHGHKRDSNVLQGNIMRAFIFLWMYFTDYIGHPKEVVHGLQIVRCNKRLPSPSYFLNQCYIQWNSPPFTWQRSRQLEGERSCCYRQYVRCSNSGCIYWQKKPPYLRWIRSLEKGES